MTKKQKTTTTVTSMKPPNTEPRWSPIARTVQNFHLVWLDENLDEINNDDCRNLITKLRQVIYTVNTFTDVDECIDFITDTKEEKTFMMVSAAYSQIIVPIVQDISQVNSIYIFCENEVQDEKWAKEGTKVKGVYTDITSICKVLNQTTQKFDQNSVSISFLKTTDGAGKENLDQLDSSFMYTQILKEILLTIDFEQEHINEFLTYCREQFVGNSGELKNVDKFEKEYRHYQPIWWYTHQYFLYSMLNRVLRLMEVDLIIKMGFFVQDLHKHITTLHAEQYSGQNHLNSFIVYRGQGLTQTDFDQLKKTNGGLLSFNNFLSTSLDPAVSVAFAESNQYDPNLTGVLFKITIDPSISSSPFANVQNVSYYQGEREILFSMHSVFRVGPMERIDQNDRLWQVSLTLTGDNDPQLLVLTESMREETKGSTGWDRLGKLMMKVGEFNKAEELYEILLKQTTAESEKGYFFQQLGQTKFLQGAYADTIEYYDKSFNILQKFLPANHPDLATAYNNIGAVYDSIGEYSKALSYYEKALEIRQKTLPANHPDFAQSYHNIAEIYNNIGEYSKALSYFEKDLEILQRILPANHPSLATSSNNLGVVYDNMGEYSKALSYYEKALEIRGKTLPANHPELATSYNNIGALYRKMGEYAKALSYYEKALEMLRKTLPANHPNLATSYNNIGEVYTGMKQYVNALSYHEKALEIQQKTLPTNYLSLATSHNNIGGMYYSMGEYPKALPYYEKALEIRGKVLPANHPSLATSYNNIGALYNNMVKYSKALSYYEKALEIRQNTLSATHPDLATSYNNIGATYCLMDDYSKSISYYERALDIYQSSLPPNHPNIEIVRESIKILNEKL